MRWLWRRLSLRHIARSPLRALITLIGIAAGVSSLVATGAANEAVLKGFRSTLEAVGGSAELTVTGPSAGGVPDDLAQKLASAPGVAAATPVISEVAKLTDGTRLQLFGIDLAGGDTSRGLDAFAGGDLPDPVVFLNDPDALLVSRKLAEERKIKVGGTLPMRTSEGVRDFHVLGLLPDTGAAEAFGGRVAVMDLFNAQAAFGRGRTVDRIDVTLAPGADRARLTSDLAAMAGAGAQVGANERRSGPVEKMLRAFQVGLLMGSGVSLLVGMFLVFNTVSFAVAQRRREIGTLRALGVTRASIVLLFALEAAIYGLLGGLLGLALGRLLAGFAVERALSGINNAYLSVNVSDVGVSSTVALTAVLLGVVGAVAAALVPAIEAARVPPVDALRRDRTAREEAPPTLLGRFTGVLIGLLGLPLMRLPMVNDTPIFGHAALAVIALGASLLAVSAVDLVHWLARRPVTRLFGAPGRVALAGLVRARRRSGVAAGAVLIGIALVLCLGTFVGSFRGALGRWIERAIPADLFVVSGATTIGLANTPMQPSIAEEVAAIPGVGEVQRVRLVWSETLGYRIGIFALEWPAYVSHAKPLITAGEPDEIRRKLGHGAVVISDNFARKTGLRVGDRVPLRTKQGLREFEIAGTLVDYSSDQGIVLFDRPSYLAAFDDPLLDSIDLYVSPGADVDAVRQQIEQRFGEKYDLRISTNAGLRRSVLDLIDDFFSLVYALLFIAVAVGVLGVVGTLLAQVLDRTRDIGILRASGASRGQIVASVTIEAALLGCAGALLGVPAGLFMGVVFMHAVGEQATGWVFPVTFPWMLALSASAISIACAALGGFWPARRAASLDIVEAVSYE